jgi:hypothetical protein
MSGNSLGAGGNFASQFQQNANNAQSADKSFLQRNVRQEKQVVEKQNIQERAETTQADSFSDKKLEENFFKEKIAGNLDLRKQITEQQKNKTQQSSIRIDANPQEQQRIASFIPRVRQLTQKQNLDETQKNEEEEENPHTSISSDLATDQNLNKNISQSDQALEKYRAFHKSGQPESGKTSRVKALIAQKKEESQQKTLNNLYAQGKKLPIQGLGLGRNVTQIRYTKGYIASLQGQAKGEEAFRVAKGLIGQNINKATTEKDLLLSEANFSPFKANAIASLRQKYIKELKLKKNEKAKPPAKKEKEKGMSISENIYQFLVELLNIETPWELEPV